MRSVARRYNDSTGTWVKPLTGAGHDTANTFIGELFLLNHFGIHTCGLAK